MINLMWIAVALTLLGMYAPVWVVIVAIITVNWWGDVA